MAYSSSLIIFHSPKAFRISRWHGDAENSISSDRLCISSSLVVHSPSRHLLTISFSSNSFKGTRRNVCFSIVPDLINNFSLENTLIMFSLRVVLFTDLQTLNQFRYSYDVFSTSNAKSTWSSRVVRAQLLWRDLMLSIWRSHVRCTDPQNSTDSSSCLFSTWKSLVWVWDKLSLAFRVKRYPYTFRLPSPVLLLFLLSLGI